MEKDVHFCMLLSSLIILSLNCLGCKSESKGLPNNYGFDPIPEGIIEIESKAIQPNSSIALDSVLETVYYVALETNDSCLIGRIDEMGISNDRIFILDKNQTESIYIFDRQGRFLTSIFRKGKGPGEYMQPADITISEVRNEIYLLNEFPSKIIVYNFKGEYLRELNLPFRFSSFANIGDGGFVFINEPNYRKYGNPPGRMNKIFSNLYFVLGDGTSFEGGGPIQVAYEENFISNGHFGLMKNGDIIYHPLFCDTIFGIRNMESYPILAVNFLEHSIDITDVAGLNRDKFIEVCIEKDYYYIDGRYNHTDKFITFFIRSVKEDLGYYTIYNRQNGDHMVFLKWQSTLFNPCNLIARAAWRDYFVSVIPALRMLDVKIGLESFDDIPDEVLTFTPSEEILQDINEFSNPVLAFYKLRPEKIAMESVFLAEE